MQKGFYFDRNSLLQQNTLFTADARLLQTMDKILIIGEIPAEVQRHMEKISNQSYFRYCAWIKEKLISSFFFPYLNCDATKTMEKSLWICWWTYTREIESIQEIIQFYLILFWCPVERFIGETGTLSHPHYFSTFFFTSSRRKIIQYCKLKFI